MKKITFRRWALLSVCIIYLAGSLSGVVTAVWPGRASAAATTYKSIKLLNQRLLNVSGNTTINRDCVATINNAPFTNTEALANLTSQSAKKMPADALQLFKEAQSNQNKNYIVITFANRDPSQVQANGGVDDCDSFAFIQTKTDQHKFYGFIATSYVRGTGMQYSFIGSASVDSTQNPGTLVDSTQNPGTLTFTSPLDNVQYANWGLEGWSGLPASAFGAAGSGGTVNGNVCPNGKFSDVTSNTQEQLCINQYNQEAVVQDFATICFRGETFVSNYWGGDKASSGGPTSTTPEGHSDEMRYAITSKHDARCGTEQDAAWASHGGSYFDINTSNAATDFNLDGGSMFDDLRNAMSNTGEIWANFVNVNVHGHWYQNGLDNNKQTTIQINATDINVVANYYPGSDKIVTVFKDGGSNESNFLGTYSKTAPGDYELDGTGNGCAASGQKPRFDNFTSVPSAVGAGAVSFGSWELGSSSDCTKSVPIPVKVLVLPNSTPLPVAPTNSQQTQATCESTSNYSLSWIMCGIVEGLQGAVGDAFDKVVSPLLQEDALNTDTKANNHVYVAWSNFRIYGDILLVIALLVVVFGESIGGGLVDAYTAKKVLPRLLAAAILINTSFYIVGFLVDVTNILGAGLIDLITKPFSVPGGFSINLGAGTATALGAGLSGAVVWGAISGSLLSFLWAFVLLPAFLTMLAIIVVVLLRRALIIFLIVIAPIAFALFCLPNTAKYFKKWWDTLLETLMIYPIIAVLFALGKVGALLINNTAGSNSLLEPVAGLLSLVALIVPLVLIPFAFRIAGGVLGKLHETIMGARDRVHKMGEGNRERIQGRMHAQRIQARQNAYSNLQAQGSKGGFVRRNTIGRGLRQLARPIGGYNIEAQASAVRAQVGKELNDQIATGRDEEIRGLSVNKLTSASRMNNGTRQFQSLGGAWINEADVDAGHRRWGHNTYAQQASLAYEMRKAQTEEQLRDLGDNYAKVATSPGGWGMSDQQAGGTWIGAAFEHQNQHLEYKYTNWQDGSMDMDKSRQFVDEVYEKKGSYPLAQMSSHTIEKLKASYTDAAARGDTDQMQKIAGISETFMHQLGTTGGLPPGEAAPTVGGTASRQANTPGAAHVAERVRELAAMSGVAHNYDTGTAGIEPTGLYGPGHQPKTPTRNRREQS